MTNYGQPEVGAVRQRRTIRAGRIILVLTLLFLIALGAAGYFGYEYWKLRKVPSSVADSQEEVDALVKEVGELILLPPDERPTVATVANLEPLKDQPFFANANVGDKVLIYTNASKAILYNPISRRVVEVASIKLGAPLDDSLAE